MSIRYAFIVALFLFSLSAWAFDEPSGPRIAIQNKFPGGRPAVLATFSERPEVSIRKIEGDLAFATIFPGGGSSLAKGRGIESTRGSASFHILQKDLSDFQVVDASGQMRPLSIAALKDGSPLRTDLASPDYVFSYGDRKLVAFELGIARPEGTPGYLYVVVHKDGTSNPVRLSEANLGAYRPDTLKRVLVEKENGQVTELTKGYVTRGAAVPMKPVERFDSLEDLKLFKPFSSESVHIPGNYDSTFHFRLNASIKDLVAYSHARVGTYDAGRIVFERTPETEKHLQDVMRKLKSDSVLPLKFDMKNLGVSNFDWVLDEYTQLAKILKQGHGVLLVLEKASTYEITYLDRYTPYHLDDVLQSRYLCGQYFLPLKN